MTPAEVPNVSNARSVTATRLVVLLVFFVNISLPFPFLSLSLSLCSVFVDLSQLFRGSLFPTPLFLLALT